MPQADEAHSVEPQATVEQYEGMLSIYDGWLNLFDQGRGEEVRAEIEARAAFFRQDILKMRGAQ